VQPEVVESRGEATPQDCSCRKLVVPLYSCYTKNRARSVFASKRANRFTANHRAETETTWLNGAKEYLLSFEQFSFDPHIAAAVKAASYTTPTPIQLQGGR
jgi:hypothetical protein